MQGQHPSHAVVLRVLSFRRPQCRGSTPRTRLSLRVLSPNCLPNCPPWLAPLALTPSTTREVQGWSPPGARLVLTKLSRCRLITTRIATPKGPATQEEPPLAYPFQVPGHQVKTSRGPRTPGRNTRDSHFSCLGRALQCRGPPLSHARPLHSLFLSAADLAVQRAAPLARPAGTPPRS